MRKSSMNTRVFQQAMFDYLMVLVWNRLINARSSLWLETHHTPFIFGRGHHSAADRTWWVSIGCCLLVICFKALFFFHVSCWMWNDNRRHSHFFFGCWLTHQMLFCHIVMNLGSSVSQNSKNDVGGLAWRPSWGLLLPYRRGCTLAIGLCSHGDWNGF